MIKPEVCLIVSQSALPRFPITIIGRDRLQLLDCTLPCRAIARKKQQQIQNDLRIFVLIAFILSAGEPADNTDPLLECFQAISDPTTNCDTHSLLIVSNRASKQLTALSRKSNFINLKIDRYCPPDSIGHNPLVRIKVVGTQNIRCSQFLKRPSCIRNHMLIKTGYLLIIVVIVVLNFCL